MFTMERTISNFESPIPLSEIESVLAWVDTFKLSRPTKKINRDFSDAVLLAEILSVHYPKLVEMHNYPPRNSHALKLNNWMTLNRKVLKKLRLTLCCNTMEQLANSAPGVIERVLVMVRDKIRRDEDNLRSNREAEQNASSGGSYYEACGDDDNVLVIPVKVRVNGVLETVQQKVISHESYLIMKEELKDAKDAADLLRQKVEHLDNLLKLKDERIEELQKQLERKQTRRKEVEAIQNSLAVPFDSSVPLSPKITDFVIVPCKTQSLKSIESNTKVPKLEESKIPVPITDITKAISKPSTTEISSTNSTEQSLNVDKIKSDVFKEAVAIEDKNFEGFQDTQEFVPEQVVVTIEDTIQKEIKEIVSPLTFVPDANIVNQN
ncbi:sperm flagellar protein 1-like isoform X2 [Epargyreus clarus]|uniref:sperm flagellar protein 1-like isoform X2 n=1 Tax=Epargyreus clarus TaxID=520877 RepID=UPI003C2D0453